MTDLISQRLAELGVDDISDLPADLRLLVTAGEATDASYAATLLDIATNPEPLTPASPDWADRMSARFGDETAWTLRYLATVSGTLDDETKDYMMALAWRLDESDYRRIKDVPAGELAAFMAPA